MNTKIPFQFSILQYVHDTFTGEFLNVGLALYCSNPRYFQAKLLTKYRRLTNTFPAVDGEHYKGYVGSMQTKFDALAEIINSKQMGFSDRQPSKIEKILESVLPVDDSSLRFGPVHGGMADDLLVIFDDLYYRLVEVHLPLEKEETRDETIIWRIFSRPLKERSITYQLRPTVIRTPKDDIEFDHAWKNGKWNALQPISFDLLHAGNIKRKSHEWFTANVLINETPDVGRIYYLLGKPQRDDASVIKAYIKAKDLLGSGKYARKVEIIEEDAAEEFASSIAPQILADTTHEDS
jgi:hypothetical protein